MILILFASKRVSRNLVLTCPLSELWTEWSHRNKINLLHERHLETYGLELLCRVQRVIPSHRVFSLECWQVTGFPNLTLTLTVIDNYTQNRTIYHKEKCFTFYFDYYKDWPVPTWVIHSRAQPPLLNNLLLDLCLALKLRINPECKIGQHLSLS